MAKTLNNVHQKHKETLKEYVRQFCTIWNSIPHIQDIEVINAFREGVTDGPTVDRLALKKPKTVGQLLAIANGCIEMAEARSLLEGGNGKKKNDDREVHVTGSGAEASGGHVKRPKGVEKWCSIHHSISHDLSECYV